MDNAFITDEQRLVLLANGRASLENPDFDPGPRGQAVHAGCQRDLASNRDGSR